MQSPTLMAYLSVCFRRHRQHPTPPVSTLYPGSYRRARVRSTYSVLSNISQSNSIPRSQPITNVRFHPHVSIHANNRILTISASRQQILVYRRRMLRYHILPTLMLRERILGYRRQILRYRNIAASLLR